jgi:Ca2+-binding EF-hand superfamily protein
MGVCISRDDAASIVPRCIDHLKAYESKLAHYAKLEPAEMPPSARIEADLRPMIEGFFDMHDSQGFGVLDKDKTDVCFHTLLSNSSPFSKAKFHLHALAMQAQASRSSTDFPCRRDDAAQAYEAAQGYEVKKQSLDVIKQALELEQEQYKEEYALHKDEYDKASFEVLDKVHDGRLRKSDLLEALLPDTELNNKLLEALGFHKLSECSEIYGIFLKQYVKELEKYARSQVRVRPVLRELHETLRPLIQCLFGLYDKDGSGIIAKDEADTFFKSLVGDMPMFSAVVKNSQIIRTLEEVNVLRTSQERLLEQEIESQLEWYTSSREKCNQAAFSVLDASQDGKLDTEEVVQALLPATFMNEQFLSALGFTKIKAKYL